MVMKFLPVENEQTADVVDHPSKSEGDAKFAEALLTTLFTTFSQRAATICSALFTVAGLAAAFWLWTTILPNPSVLNLIGVGMFAVFILAFEFVRRRT